MESYYSIKTSFHVPRTDIAREAMEDLQDIFGKDMKVNTEDNSYLVEINYFKTLPNEQIKTIGHELEYISEYLINPADVFIEHGNDKYVYTLGETKAKKEIHSILNKLTEKKQNQVLEMIKVLLKD